MVGESHAAQMQLRSQPATAVEVIITPLSDLGSFQPKMLQNIYTLVQKDYDKPESEECQYFLFGNIDRQESLS